MRETGKRSILMAIGIVFFLALLTSALKPKTASAAEITTRSLTLVAGATAGGSDPGGVVDHLFSFTTATTGSVGSIQFLYCTAADGTCTTPTGLLTTSATLSSQSGATGFTINNSTNGSPYITRTAASISSGTALSYQLNSITNPTATNTTFYVRISTFASTDTTGGVTDSGVVAASTANAITLTGIMPESLIFCDGATVGTTGGVPDCTTATSGAVSFNQLFSSTSTTTATSQMAASTNAQSGYVITVNGATLTSGANTIPAMNSATTSSVATGQFGLNLMANTTPSVGTALAPTSDGVSFKGEALTGYNTANTFKFTTGDSVANSSVGGAGGTDAQIYTVSYIVNVEGRQAPGTYTTTLTYICTPTF